jgi:hypothetical protein
MSKFIFKKCKIIQIKSSKDFECVKCQHHQHCKNVSYGMYKLRSK